MAISIDWPTGEIFIPKADLLLLQSDPAEIRQLNLDDFRKELKNLEDDPEGMPWPKTHDHNPPLSISGVILARAVNILPPYTITFEDGQYAVNLVGANTNLADRTNVNQVSVRPSNSAGLQDLSTLLAAAYRGRVHVDPINGQAGTTVPLGTRRTPVNNMAQALIIAEENSIKEIQIMKSLSLTSSDFSNGYRFIGDNPATSVLTIEEGANVQNCVFEAMIVQGVLDGSNTFRNCSVLDISYVNGFIFQCALIGRITLGGGAQATILNCWSGHAAGGQGFYPTIDMGSTGNSLVLQNYSGDVELANYVGGGAVSIALNSGWALIADTVVGGSIYVLGQGSLLDLSGPGASVYNQMVSGADKAGEELWATVLEGDFTAADLIRLLASIGVGDATGLEGNTPIFKSLDGLTERLRATYADGTRQITYRDAN